MRYAFIHVDSNNDCGKGIVLRTDKISAVYYSAKNRCSIIDYDNCTFYSAESPKEILNKIQIAQWEIE